MSELEKTMQTRFRVGIVMHSGQEHMRQVALGVINFAQLNPSWQISSDGFYPLIPWENLKSWSGDGIVAIVNTRQQFEILKGLGKPFVLAGSRILDNQYSIVASDNHAIGRMTARHLFECGYRRLIFFGQTVWDDEQQRLDGFAAMAKEVGVQCQAAGIQMNEYEARDSLAHYHTNLDQLVECLVGFEPPFGVFCPNAVIARGLVEACNIAGLAVPDDVGIIGVNNDVLECESIRPAISTVVQQSQRIGFRAAELLDRVRQGGRVEQHFLEPKFVVARRSTDVALVNDPDVENAMRFIRDNIDRGIGIKDVAEAVGISRRNLEVKFRRVLQRTPLRELNRVRIRKAQQLLRFSDSSITSIALESGFGSSQALSSAFKKACGCSPSEYRKKTEGW